MTIRGLYRLGTGEFLHNSFTSVGLTGLLAAALRNSYPAGGLYVGLCQAVPSSALTLADLLEPTIGVNGYARQLIERSAVGWETNGFVGNDPYEESKLLTFTATGAYSQAITRLFLTPEATATTGQLWAISASLAAPLQIDGATPLGQRQFNYRIYGS